MFEWFKRRNEKDLEFVDTHRTVYQHHPVRRAKDVKPLTFDIQKKKYGKHMLPHCPGMIDYAEVGYIVPAWIDMHILANKAGVVHYIGSASRGPRGFSQGREMDPRPVEGTFELQDGIPAVALNFGSPWGVFASKNISALVMPAYYHSNVLDDLHVIPGVVDYKKFHTLNFICMPKRKCEVHIKAGDPLLHVIPIWNKEFNAGYGPGTQEQLDAFSNEIAGDDKQYYRKYYMFKKSYNIQSNEETS